MALPRLKLELLDDGLHARLLERYQVYVQGRTITVPPGFVTDFASVPRFFWRILPPFGRYSPAAVVHDYLYATALVTRREADSIFYDLMRLCDVPAWKRSVMAQALRVFGGRAWAKHRRKEKE